MRRPSVVVPMPKLIVDTYCRALWSAGRRPIAVLEGASGTEDNMLLASLIREARLYKVMREATRRALSLGTGIVAWRIQDGRFVAEAWDPKWARPQFRPGAFPALAEVDYRFPFEREIEDARGTHVRTLWARQVVSETTWTVYHPTEVADGREPEWRRDSALSVDHGLGFVPVVWMTVGERGPHEHDGTSIYASLLSLFDDINFTASQQARSLYYNLDPQLVLTGVAETDVQVLMKGPNTWPLPKDADAKLLESSGSYIAQSETRLQALRKWCLDAAAVVINDPERISGAQSGTALELLCAPMLARVDDLRDELGDCGLVAVLQQMLAALGAPSLKGARIGLRDQLGRADISASAWHAFPVTLRWGPHFPATPTDAQTAAQAAERATALGIISKTAAARYLAPFFGVADVEADQEQVRRQDGRVTRDNEA